jgi:signal transduction histidine kinase
MPQLLSKRILSEARVATRPMPDKTVAAILRSLLLFTEEGILVTDLEHKSLAVNEKFGELFRVTPHDAVGMDPEELRKRVYPRLQNPKEWVDQLDQIYAKHDLVHEDELELLGEPPIYLARITGPIFDAEGAPVARMWRFRDISAHKRREKMRDLLLEVSTCRDADPALVCKLVVQKLSDFYKSSAILSIRDGDKMVFREMAGMPVPFSWARSNKIKNAYCQVALETVQPLLVQNGRKHPELCRLPAPKLGFTRYLGVPICDRGGEAIGTLCIMDGKSEIPLDADDEQFLSMLGLRVATELDREHIYLERTAEQRALLEKQQQGLSETHQVVTAMNRAFEMASTPMSTDVFLANQVLLLKGLLGYDAAAVLLPAEDGVLSGYSISANQTEAHPFRVRVEDSWILTELMTETPITNNVQVRFSTNPAQCFKKAFASEFLAFGHLPVAGSKHGMIIFSAKTQPSHTEQRHLVLLEAVIDQICLLLTAHTLQQNLLLTHDELKATQQRLVQTEKLSVVGTLAASIAHDIRNIVSSLALECSLGDTDPATALANVRMQLDRFAVLAHRLLSYAKPKLMSKEPVEINDLIRRVIALTASQTRVAGVSLISELPTQPVRGMVDASQTEHLFVNLVLNAVQALRPNGGNIWIKTEFDDKIATVSVRDNGPGIPPTELERIFEPFHTTRPEGFGLGLYSCRRIAEDQGWKLALDSTPGKGTTFKVTIPLCGEQNA